MGEIWAKKVSGSGGGEGREGFLTSLNEICMVVVIKNSMSDAVHQYQAQMNQSVTPGGW